MPIPTAVRLPGHRSRSFGVAGWPPGAAAYELVHGRLVPAVPLMTTRTGKHKQSSPIRFDLFISSMYVTCLSHSSSLITCCFRINEG